MTKQETEIKTLKTSRVSETRAKNEKPKVWTPPSALDAPPAPDGYRHRWIRTESMGQLAKSREAYFEGQRQDREEALNNDVLKEQHPSMPINQDRQTRVTFGGSKK